MLEYSIFDWCLVIEFSVLCCVSISLIELDVDYTVVLAEDFFFCGVESLDRMWTIMTMIRVGGM